MRKLTHQEIVARQEQKSREARLPFTVVLNNIRSLYNVGSIFRTADGAGVEKIWLCGYTGYPPQSQIAKTALGAEQRVPWEHHQDAVVVIQQLKKQGYTIVLLEQLDQSIEYHQFVPPGPVCLVVGNEIEGISEGLLPYCDCALEIAMSGVKNSLNVAVAFGIIAYHWNYYLTLNKI
jgi:tRNA G18 (ribose-2'-O)-methylase SpoU